MNKHLKILLHPGVLAGLVILACAGVLVFMFLGVLYELYR